MKLCVRIIRVSEGTKRVGVGDSAGRVEDVFSAELRRSNLVSYNNYLKKCLLGTF